MNKVKFKRMCLRRILKSMFFFRFVLYVSVASASHDYMLWGTKSNASGSIKYSGIAIDSVTGTVNSLHTGTMSVLYKNCTLPSTTTTFYRAEDRWIFLPKKIDINGQSAAISVSSVPSGYTLNSYNNSHYLLKQNINIYYYKENRECSVFSVGKTFPINYIYPDFSIEMDVSGLSVGSYSGTIPIKMAYAEYFGKTSSDITKFSDSRAFQDSTDTEVPYTINIMNKCTVSPTEISLNHGELSVDAAEGHSVSQDVSIDCDEAASLKVSVSSRSVPRTLYSDGVGVGLGNGWDSILQIGNSGLSDYSLTDKTVSVSEGSTSMQITSMLRKNGTVSAGNISGSMVFSITLD
ncbi:PapG chaperone-binding domain-containing protein [Escherichia coli]